MSLGRVAGRSGQLDDLVGRDRRWIKQALNYRKYHKGQIVQVLALSWRDYQQNDLQRYVHRREDG
jgi:hypothetical protein